MPAGKIIAHHRGGQGKIAADRLTVLHAGPVGDTGATKAAADTFIDVAPHLSLRGLDISRNYNRRGNTMLAHDESHIQARTRGQRVGKKPDNRFIVAKGEFGNGR